MIETIISHLVSIIIGLGGALLFYRSRSRKEGAEAYNLELNGLKDEVEFLNERLEKLREETGRLRDDFVKLKEHSMEQEIQLIDATKQVRVLKTAACYRNECTLRQATQILQ